MKKSNKKIYIPILFACIALLAVGFAAVVLDDTNTNFTTTGNDILIKPGVYEQFNFTVTNNATNTNNITQINVTFNPSVFNVTNATANVSWSATINQNQGYVNWTNNTAGAALNDTTGIFILNVTLIESPPEGNYTFTLYAYNATGNYTNKSFNVTIDKTSPAIVSNIANNTNFTTSNITFSWNVTDTIDLNTTCNLTIYNSTGIFNTSNVTANNGTTTYQVTNFVVGAYNWSVNCTDDVGYSNITSGLFGAYPDLTIINITYSTAPNTTAPNLNDNITSVNVTVKNIGSFNFTTADGSGNATVTVTVPGLSVINGSQNVNNATLIADATVQLNFTNILIDPTANAIYNLTATIDATGQVTEANETNNTLTKPVVIGYNVTLLNITSPGASQTVNASGTINVSVSVKYADGSNVSSLNSSNFTVWDKWTTGGSDSLTSLTLTNFSAAQSASGIYWFNLTVPAVSSYAAQYNLHNLTVEATAGSYSGNATNGWYNLTAPKLTVSISGLSSNKDLTDSTSDEFDIIINNDGTAPIYNVSVYNISTDLGELDRSKCPSSPITINANSNYTCENIEITYSDTGTATVRAYANGTYNSAEYRASGSDSADITQSSTTTTGTAGTAECTTNSDCSAAYKCVSGTCTRLNCSTDETIVNHACVKQYAVNITKWPTALEIEQGAMKNETINVKNIGENALTTVKLSLSGVNWSNWYTVSPNNVSSLAQSSTTTFSINITVPANATIASYTITANASSTNTSDTQDFAVKVLPSETSKVAINATLKELEANITSVSTELNTLLAQINSTNLTSANATMNSVRTLLQEAKDAIDAGDYFTAYQKMSQATSLLDEVKTIIATESKKIGGIPWLWIGIGGGVAAAAVIIIILLSFVKTGGAKTAAGALGAIKALKPAKPSGFAYKPQTNKPGRAKEKIKEAFRKLREKMRRKPKEQMQLHQWTKRGWSPK